MTLDRAHSQTRSTSTRQVPTTLVLVRFAGSKAVSTSSFFFAESPSKDPRRGLCSVPNSASINTRLGRSAICPPDGIRHTSRQCIHLAQDGIRNTQGDCRRALDTSTSRGQGQLSLSKNGGQEPVRYSEICSAFSSLLLAQFCHRSRSQTTIRHCAGCRSSSIKV